MSDKNILKLAVAGGTAIVKQGDITREHCDAIVNAANSTLLGGGGVDGAIHRAGGPAILAECKDIVGRIGRCRTGEAVITGGGNLSARHVIHAVGPVWRNGDSGEPALLASAYKNAMRLARENHLASIAFPSISTGAYGYPIASAATIALRTVLAEMGGTIREVRFILFSAQDLDVYREAAPRLAQEMK